MLIPTYGENIIVGIILKGKFIWFVTEKDYWFMDYAKLEEAYEQIGHEVDTSEDERFGIRILSNDNIQLFLEKIKDYIVTKEYLKKLFLEHLDKMTEDDDILDFSPSILIDFDRNIFYSMYPEPASFEEYVPKGWNGTYSDFTNYVPDDEKYWINSDGDNLFLRG